MEFANFFREILATDHSPFPYQQRLAQEEWPEVLDVPTGLGKTAAVIVSWLYKRLQSDEETATRLAYCLPMRVLVEQTRDCAQSWCERAAPHFHAASLPVPTVHTLMGGEVDNDWENRPEEPAILIGTQDMLLSRALNRGFAMSRYKWPVHYSLLNNDCLWVFDETQLVGVGIETSAQLQGLRTKLGAHKAHRTLWMSATLGEGQLDTVDHRRPEAGWSAHRLSEADLDNSVARARVSAKKPIDQIQDLVLTKDTAKKGYIDQLAGRLLKEHALRGGLTLVVLNRVQRAQELYEKIRKAPGRGTEDTALIHSRFRPADRGQNESVLLGKGDRIVVATQAVEAGVDVSARTLFTELAPWPSLVQRFGRCNRYGGDEVSILWADIDTQIAKSDALLPYEASDLDEARKLLEELINGDQDAGPESLKKLDYSPPSVVRPVIRRRDVLDLFDTTPDLCGNDIDISRYVRDGEDTDVQIYWRAFGEAQPPIDTPQPERAELCRVSVAAFSKFQKRLDSKRKKLERSTKKADRDLASQLHLWVWDSLEKNWSQASHVRPGQVALLHSQAGGYDLELGWTGETKTSVPEATLAATSSHTPADEDSMESDARTNVGRWVLLKDHLGHVRDEAGELASALNLGSFSAVLQESGLWHDVGKAHEEFQKKLLAPLETHPDLQKPSADGPWAKSNHQLSDPTSRRHFRHELASALAWLALYDGDDARFRDLVAYLVAAHHGKVRMSIRSIPGEQEPKERGRLFARGVWDGDVLDSFELPGGTAHSAVHLDLSLLQLGEGSWLERTLGLRDAPDLGPFRLALLETVVRIADWRASEKEQKELYDE